VRAGTVTGYFGSYTGLPMGFGTPPGFTPPNGRGGTVKPFHFTSLTENGGDPNHDWDAIHSEWDHGKMDGFYTINGKVAMGYYKSSDLPYYYSLFPQFTLCANYFCGVLSKTYPNRLVPYSGTSGEIPATTSTTGLSTTRATGTPRSVT
jgi:phospholipase C